MKEIEDFLKSKGITPTPVRMLVYRCLLDSEVPMSLSDLEIELESVDKSTISRTLSLLKENHLLHSFNDGSGSVKYEICRSGDHGHKDDTHVHFRCNSCGRTICLTSVKIPEVTLPEGFLVLDTNYIITGVCNECRK